MTRKVLPPTGRPLREVPTTVDSTFEQETVLASLFEWPDLLATWAPVLAQDVFDGNLGAIARTMFSLHERGEPVAYETVAIDLKRRGLLNNTQGALAHVFRDVPVARALDPIVESLMAAWRKRELRSSLQRALDLATDPAEPASAIIERVRRELDEVDQPGAAPIFAAWSPLGLAQLTTPPPPRRWLFRHPTRDGAPCPRGDGDGLLPRGKVGVLASEGGVGKTMLAIDAAVSLATGRRFLGHFDVDPGASGKIFLGLAEEDTEEVHRRFFAAAKARELDDEELGLVVDRVMPLALAGRSVSVIAYAQDGRAVIDSAVLTSLRNRLTREAGELGWALVMLDPLARWAGPDVEVDNEMATRFVQALETLTRVPGHPAVLVAHHSSKLARRNGAVDSRGVTAITDAVRWAATLRNDGADVYFVQSKSNYSRPMLDELRLVRGDGGLLRVPTATELQSRAAREKQRDDVKTDAEEKAIETIMAGLVTALRGAKAPVTSRGQLVGLVRGAQRLKQQALSRLLATDRMRRVPPSGKGDQAHFEVSC